MYEGMNTPELIEHLSKGNTVSLKDFLFYYAVANYEAGLSAENSFRSGLVLSAALGSGAHPLFDLEATQAYKSFNSWCESDESRCK